MSEQSFSFTQASWKRLRKNKGAIFGLIIIGLAVIVAVFAYYIAPDSSPYANRIILEIGGNKPGFQQTFLLVKKERTAQVSSFFSRLANGKEDSYYYVPVTDAQKLGDSMIVQKFIDEGKVTVHLNTTTDEIIDTDGRVSKVKITENGVASELVVDGIFVFVGLVPNTQFLEGSGVELDEVGLVKTNQHLETSVKGIYASGDVRSGATMQIASAVGEGAAAALSIREYLGDYHREDAY